MNSKYHINNFISYYFNLLYVTEFKTNNLGPCSGFSIVIRFATKSVLQNIRALVVVIHTPPLTNKRYEALSHDELYYIAE